MRVEMNWEEEFPECADAVKKLVKKLGHTPVEPVELQVGMRVEVEGKKCVIVSKSGKWVTVAFDYYTRKPRLQSVHINYVKPCVNRDLEA